MKKNIQVFLFFLITSVSLTAQEKTESIEEESMAEESGTLLWAEVKGAKGYQVQVRDEKNQTVLDKKTPENSFKVKLPFGKYEHRVGVYNKFGKLGNFSEWVKFAVTKSLVPEITGEKQIEVIISSKRKKISIKGNYLYTYTKVSLQNSRKQIKLENLKKVSADTVEFEISYEDFSPDVFDLVLENPKKKILKIEKFLVLKNRWDSAETVIRESQDKPAKDVPGKDSPGKEIAGKNTDPVKPAVKGRYPYWKEAGMSALLPGRGQFMKNQAWKGIVFDGMLVLGAAYYYYSYQEFLQAKNNYNAAVLNGVYFTAFSRMASGNASSTGLILGNLSALSNSESKYKRGQDKASAVQGAAILIGLVYTLNILDALLWKVPEPDAALEEGRLRMFTNMGFVPAFSQNAGFAAFTPEIQFGLNYRF